MFEVVSRIYSGLDGFFLLTERGTNVTTEIRAGVAAFLTLSYLLLVNPQIMAKAGVPHDDAVFATALSSAVACFVVGIGGNLPFGLAPGLGLSAYLTYGLVQSGLTTVEEALTASFASGIFLLLFAISGLAHFIMNIVPKSIKLGIVVGMGILIAMIGMVSVDLIVANPKTLVQLGDLTTWNMQLVLVGTILVASLIHHDVKGGILIGITLLMLVVWTVDNSFPSTIVSIPSLDRPLGGWLKIDALWDWELAPTLYSAVGTFLLICLFDVSGVMFGLASLSGLLQEDGTIPGSLWAFLASSAGTIVAGLMGSTPIIVTVECASGVKEGGRTGLSACVIGLLFSISLFLAPLFGSVPEEATAPVLILIGAMMMGESGKIDWEHMHETLPAFLTIVMMPLTYSITNGMLFGMGASAAFYFTTGNIFRDGVQVLKKYVENGEVDRPLLDDNELGERAIATTYGSVETKD